MACKRKSKLQKEWEKYLRKLGSKDIEFEYKLKEIILHDYLPKNAG